MYEIGEYIVYRQLNVCKVVAIETPDFETDPQKKYYKLSPVFNNKNETTIYIPVDSDASIRAVSDEKTAKESLSALSKLSAKVFAAKKPPQLVAHYQELLATLDPEKYLLLIKEVMLKERTDGKKVNEIDTRFKNRTEKLVCEEFAVALQITPEEIRERIYREIG